MMPGDAPEWARDVARAAWEALPFALAAGALSGALCFAARVPEEVECDGWADARAKHLGAIVRSLRGSPSP